MGNYHGGNFYHSSLFSIFLLYVLNLAMGIKIMRTGRKAHNKTKKDITYSILYMKTFPNSSVASGGQGGQPPPLFSPAWSVGTFAIFVGTFGFVKNI